MTRDELASFIDHTLLRPEAARDEIIKLCREAAEFGFASACVNPVWVRTAAEVLEGCRPVTCSVIGFPLGASTVMPREAMAAIADGAGELDMVIPVGLLKSGMDREVSATIGAVVEASSGVPVKVIIETCLLTDSEKVRACRIAMESGASWVKTSTGFSSGGATVEDVRLMREAVSDRLGVKASGGIRTLEDALGMLAAGAGRLGCSRSVQIVRSIEE